MAARRRAADLPGLAACDPAVRAVGDPGRRIALALDPASIRGGARDHGAFVVTPRALHRVHVPRRRPHPTRRRRQRQGATSRVRRQRRRRLLASLVAGRFPAPPFDWATGPTGQLVVGSATGGSVVETGPIFRERQPSEMPHFRPMEQTSSPFTRRTARRGCLIQPGVPGSNSRWKPRNCQPGNASHPDPCVSACIKAGAARSRPLTCWNDSPFVVVILWSAAVRVVAPPPRGRHAA